MVSLSDGGQASIFAESRRKTINFRRCGGGNGLSSLEAQFPDCGLILIGDFNELDLSRVVNAFGVKQVVPFPTRGQSKLDLVFTNLNAYYDVPKKLSPFGFSDHVTVEVHPLEREKLPSQKIVLQSRDLRATNRLAMRTYLEEVVVCSLVGSLVSCQEKTDTLETVIKTGMDILLPLTSKIVMSNDRPLINKQMKSLIKQRQVAFTPGDLDSFRSLRNRVDRLRKSCRAKNYETKVEHLMNCKPRTWWKEVKTLGSMKSATRTDPVSVLTLVQPVPNSSPTALADTVNEAFVEPLSNFTPLGPVSTADARYSNPPSVSEFCVLKKLSVLNPAKSSGPDMIPSWLVKENEDLLAPAVTDIINCSFAEARLPQSWKHADIVPVPKQVAVYDVNKHLRPISLTPVLSKVAEEFVVEQ